MSAIEFLVLPKNSQRRMNFFKQFLEENGVDEHTVFMHYCMSLTPDQQCTILEDLARQLKLNVPIEEEE